MALISCPECKTEISDTALNCPKCGVQLRRPTRSFFGKLVKWSFALFNIFMAIWLVGGMSSATKHIGTAMSEAEKAGAAIGTGLGAAGYSWYMGLRRYHSWIICSFYPSQITT